MPWRRISRSHQRTMAETSPPPRHWRATMVRLMYGAGAAPPQIVVADDERGVRWPGGGPA